VIIMAEQLEFYFPKTKSKHMAMPTTGKKYPSKGGTVRFGVQASMNGSMSLPKYVKEEEFYDYGFGVDSVVRKYPQKFMDAFYDFDSNPTADTQDDETVAIAYQAWYQKQAENEVLNAEVSVGEKQITNRKDYDIDNELSGFSNMEVGDIDLEDYEDEITEAVEDEVIEAIRESVDDNIPISDGDSVSSYVNVDTELEITVPISGDIDYDWTANENFDENEDGWNAETGLEAITEPEVFGGSNYAVKMIKNAQNHLKMVRGAENISREGTFNIDIEAYIDNEDELEERGFSERDIEAMKQNVEEKYKDGDAVFEKLKEDNLDVYYDDLLENDRDEVYLKYGDKMVGGVESGIEYSGDFGGFNADTVGNPSPSSPLDEVPATVPSPAEPTNESFNAETDNYKKIYKDPKTGEIRVKKSFYIVQTGEDSVSDFRGCQFEGCAQMGSPEWYSDDYCSSACANEMQICGENKPFLETFMGRQRMNEHWNEGAYGDFCQSLTEDVDGMEMCNDCDYQGTTYGAEMDELSEDTSIIRNRVGDMVGMVELDENDEDIEKVDVDIIDDDGEMAYEGTLGAETFESQGTNTKMILGITALAVGLGLWKGKEIMSISEKITESIKNMRK